MIREAVSRLASTVSPSSSTLKRLSSPSTIVISVQAQTGLHRIQGSDNRVTCIQINQQIPMFSLSLFFLYQTYFRDPLSSLTQRRSFGFWDASVSRVSRGKQKGPEPTAADGLPGRSRKSWTRSFRVYWDTVTVKFPRSVLLLLISHESVVGSLRRAQPRRLSDSSLRPLQEGR